VLACGGSHRMPAAVYFCGRHGACFQGAPARCVAANEAAKRKQIVARGILKMGVNDELTWLDATAQAELVAKGAVSPAELVEAAIARIERLNPQLNCVIFQRYDKARAEARNQGAIPGGIFRGVPFLMKDLLQTTEGEPFSWGWKPFKAAKIAAQSTSYVAAKFRAAGLITLAQSTVPEWGTTLST
jgi:amidase